MRFHDIATAPVDGRPIGDLSSQRCRPWGGVEYRRFPAFLRCSFTFASGPCSAMEYNRNTPRLDAREPRGVRQSVGVGNQDDGRWPVGALDSGSLTGADASATVALTGGRLSGSPTMIVSRADAAAPRSKVTATS